MEFTRIFKKQIWFFCISVALGFNLLTLNGSTNPISLTENKESELMLANTELDNESKELFDRVWMNLSSETDGEENLAFPKEIIWLTGAPGAGKNTHAKFIMEFFGLKAAPIVTGELLNRPEFIERIDNGLLVDDRSVTELIIKELTNPKYKNGVIIDGYPRTPVQAKVISYLFDKIQQSGVKFYIVLLTVDEDESVRRQLHRGKQALENNKRVKMTGKGQAIEVRATDVVDREARHRYEVYLAQTMPAFNILRAKFPFHDVDSSGEQSEAAIRIRDELLWQEGLHASQSLRQN